jgi:hypothetical protein
MKKLHHQAIMMLVKDPSKLVQELLVGNLNLIISIFSASLLTGRSLLLNLTLTRVLAHVGAA